MPNPVLLQVPEGRAHGVEPDPRHGRQAFHAPLHGAAARLINRKAQRYLKQGEPVISVDTKKKELVGDFKNAGREWELKGQPEEVRVHDFEIREADKGKVAPYGVYDLGPPAYIAVGLSGVWNFRGTIGKENDANGRRRDVNASRNPTRGRSSTAPAAGCRT
jgi:hypothetical protein